MIRQRSVKTAWIFAIVSALVTPLLIFVQVAGVFLVGMVIAEPANSVLVKALVVLTFVAIALLAALFPLLAYFSHNALAPRVIAAVVMLAWLVTQLYVVGIFSGVCSLEGCFPA